MITLTLILCVFGETKYWDVATRDQWAAGREFREVVLHSRGVVRAGYATREWALDTESAFWCGLRTGRDEYVLGTGSGRIVRLRDGTFETEFETGEMLVTALAAAGSRLFAATIPNGKIFARETGGEWREFCAVPSKYVWALVPDGDGLFAAGGSPGTVWRISRDGEATALYESPAEHVLAMTRAGDRWWFGTAQPGYLVEWRDGSGRIASDFGADEVRAVAADGESAIAAVNAGIQKPPHEFLSLIEQSAQPQRPPEPQAQPTGKGPETPAPPQERPAEAKPTRARTPAATTAGISTTVWRIAGARAERLATVPNAYVAALACLEDGVWIGTHNSGRVFRIAGDGAYDVVHDFPQNQVLEFVVEEGRIAALLLGDRAAVRIPAGRAAEGVYESDILDAKFPARWGALSALGTGDFVVETRSGQVSDPQLGWSEWQAPQAGRIASPPGRYMQFRVRLRGDAEVRRVRIAYRNENQRPQVAQVQIQAVIPPDPTAGMMPGQRPGPSPLPGQPHAFQKQIQWTAQDPEGDTLVFRLYVRRVGDTDWVPVFRGPYRQVQYVWDTRDWPDGWYHLRLEASDELANTADEALTGAYETDPILVDNTPPEILFEGIRDGRLRGVARDAASAIRRIEVQVDGGEWRAIQPEDGILDSTEERFSVATDGRRITVRVLDEENNVGTRSFER